MKLTCCYIDMLDANVLGYSAEVHCTETAEFEIASENAGSGMQTYACERHVGAMLETGVSSVASLGGAS